MHLTPHFRRLRERRLWLFLLDTINPYINFFVIECNESLDLVTFSKGREIPPDDILGNTAAWQIDIVIVRLALRSRSMRSAEGRVRGFVHTLYGQAVLRGEGFRRSMRQSVFGMYVRTGKPVSNKSLGLCVFATSTPFTSTRTCREDCNTSILYITASE